MRKSRSGTGGWKPARERARSKRASTTGRDCCRTAACWSATWPGISTTSPTPKRSIREVGRCCGRSSTRAPPMLIRIKKKTDGSAALSCVRDDGSVTWQRQEGIQGRFFPLHDLTHYAVETVLGHRRGFYGLVAAGWDLTDFGQPWPRGPLPPEALGSGPRVGFLARGREAGGGGGRARGLNATAGAYFARHGVGESGVVTEANLGEGG